MRPARSPIPGEPVASRPIVNAMMARIVASVDVLIFISVFEPQALFCLHKDSRLLPCKGQTGQFAVRDFLWDQDVLFWLFTSR